jgi:hypothetical protein
VGTKKMKKLILSVIFTIALFAGFNASELKASELKANEISGLSVKRTTADNYVYVKVYENGAIWTYTYTLDGIFVSKVISN